ncbi:hypothetical protein NPIL_455021 [Nephila pilipes]|uniref:Uncharacterized protein n=1 Tax=Nephila pilipes TaxID=299642 RepID=A0A8X6QGK7_NEPPI|nr:hypothetical protein NPIL_455021 [Nephila pilipes]
MFSFAQIGKKSLELENGRWWEKIQVWPLTDGFRSHPKRGHALPRNLLEEEEWLGKLSHEIGTYVLFQGDENIFIDPQNVSSDASFCSSFPHKRPETLSVRFPRNGFAFLVTMENQRLRVRHLCWRMHNRQLSRVATGNCFRTRIVFSPN